MISKSALMKIVVNTTVGVGLVVIWLQFVDINKILETISQVQLLSLLPVFFLLFLSAALRAFRLKIILAPKKKISLKDLTFLNGAAILFNFLIPIRAGEVVKGFYLNNRYNLPIAKSLIWVFLDRFIDLLVVLAVAAILLLIVPTSLNIIIIVIITVIFLFGFFTTYILTYQVGFARKMLKFLSHLLILPNIKIYFERIFNFFLDSFGILKRKPADLAKIFGVTLLAYGSDALVWYFGFLSLGTNQDLVKMYLAQLLSALTYLIPAAPGYVGSAEASGVLIFSGVFGMDPNLASAMIVLFHITTAIFVIGFGVLSIYNLKINTGLILKKVLRKD